MKFQMQGIYGYTKDWRGGKDLQLLFGDFQILSKMCCFISFSLKKNFSFGGGGGQAHSPLTSPPHSRHSGGSIGIAIGAITPSNGTFIASTTLLYHNWKSYVSMSSTNKELNVQLIFFFNSLFSEERLQAKIPLYIIFGTVCVLAPSPPKAPPSSNMYRSAISPVIYTYTVTFTPYFNPFHQRIPFVVALATYSTYNQKERTPLLTLVLEIEKQLCIRCCLQKLYEIIK